MNIDLSKLNIARLKAYRKSLIRKCAVFEICNCGEVACDHELGQNINNPNYLKLKLELERVNLTLSQRQKLVRTEEEKKKWAHVSTIGEEKRHFNQPWREVKKNVHHEKKNLVKKLRNLHETLHSKTT